jgi:predicted DNA-binding ribbon-helix-helix protein
VARYGPKHARHSDCFDCFDFHFCCQLLADELDLGPISMISRLRVARNESLIQRRTIIIGGHRTSVSLEDAFWSELREIADSQRATVSKLVAQIDDTRQQSNLSSAIRLYVLEHIRRHGPNNPRLSLGYSVHQRRGG